MPRQTNKIEVFTSEDMALNPVFTRCVNANIGFYVQFNYTGAAGAPVVTFYTSIDGVNWIPKTLKDPDTCKPIPNVPLSGAAGADAVEIGSWRADWIKIEVTGATAGTITSKMDYQENNNTY